MTEKELRAELKAGKLRPAYFFCGDEEYLKRAARRTLRQTVLPGWMTASASVAENAPRNAREKSFGKQNNNKTCKR